MDAQKKTAVYKQIYRTLLDEINEGVYQPSSKLPSEKMLCTRFEVERNTVRKALQLLVEQGLIKKIPGFGTVLLPEPAESEAMSQEMPQMKGMILMLIQRKDHLSEHFHLMLYDMLEKRLSDIGYMLTIKIIDHAEDLDAMINGTQPVALIFDSRFSRQFYEKAINRGLPCVSINHATSAMTSIVNNNVDGAKQMIKMLHEYGHQRIAIITGPHNFQTTLDRLAGIQNFFLKNNLNRAGISTYIGDWSRESGYKITRQLMCSTCKEHLPTAIFCFNDDMAYGCLHALTEFDITVPDQMSVVGFDKSYKYQNIFREITTVDCNMNTLTDYAVWYLKSCLDTNSSLPSVTIEVQTNIIDSGTVTAIRK